MTPREPAGVYEAWRLAEASARGPFAQENTELRERALRWEALARQLEDALESIVDDAAPHGPRSNATAYAAIAMRALSVYRAAIKEDE